MPPFLLLSLVLMQEPADRVATSVFAAAATADWVSTYRFMHSGVGKEDNPALNWVGKRPVATVALGASMDIVGAWAWKRYVGRRHPKLARVGFYAAAGFRIWLTVRNERIKR